MISAITAWLGSAAVGALFQALKDMIVEVIDNWRRDQALVESGRVAQQRDDAAADLEAQQQMAIIAARRDSRQDLLSRLDEGSA